MRPRVARPGTFLILALVLAPPVTVLILRKSLPKSGRSLNALSPNNPNHFWLWSSPTGFTSTFRYDHRATDIWMFRSGGGLNRLKPLDHTEGISTNSTH